MKHASPSEPPDSRLVRHRTRATAGGSPRVVVTVPAGDAGLVKAVADALRAGGPEAARDRDALRPVMAPARARTGAELVAFLRGSPLVGAELEAGRDKSAGRAADIG